MKQHISLSNFFFFKVDLGSHALIKYETEKHLSWSSTQKSVAPV